MCNVLVVPEEGTTLPLWRDQWKAITDEASASFITHVYGLNTVPGQRAEDGALSGFYLTGNCQAAIRQAEDLCLEPWMELFVRLRSIDHIPLSLAGVSAHGELPRSWGRRRVFYVLHLENHYISRILALCADLLPGAVEANEIQGEWGSHLFGTEPYRTTFTIPAFSRGKQDWIRYLAMLRQQIGVTYAIAFAEEG